MSPSQRKKDFSPPSQLTKNPSPNSKGSKNVLHIGGIQVKFPYQPYGAQLAFMNRVISTLDRAQRDGHCHALLESPTGTGKSLSLLCSSLAWQQNAKLKNLQANLSQSSSKPHPEAVTDPDNCGGGFIPESQPSYGNVEKGAPAGTNGKNKKKKLVPTIFYASRTHSQIRQVIQEYRKTTYRVPMTVLASRKHYCTNKGLRESENIDEQCKLLLKDREVGCSEFKNTHKVKGHPSLQKGGCHEAHDIEDLVKIGEVVKGCSYFAARAMAEDAELVFCPYNYIINPVIRRAMEVDIEGAIIILDEAHNIEDVARDAGSTDVQEDVLLQLQTELQQLRTADPMTYQPLLEMVQDILSWMDRRKKTLQKHEFQHYFSCWTGDKALAELEEANVTRKCFLILQDCASKAFKAASDAELGVACLSGMAATVLEGLFSSFNYFFSGNGLHANDYLLVIQRCAKRDGVRAAGGWTHSLSLWCLNPAVVFRDIACTSLSVILTSGTLSPINSFSSELGVQFGTCLEAPHVIDVESQLWAAVIPRGPGSYPLNSSYKTAEAYTFQDELGTSLEEICKVVPGGCLVFFPSYKLMDKLCNRWQETGQWSRLNAQKSLFIEPRGGSQEALELVLNGYYNSVNQRSKPVVGRKKRVKKSDQRDIKGMESSQYTKTEGAAFLAVCRGKISEGIDFSDDNARVVIVVGIPFPNIYDIQVAQKKKFNDTYRSSKNLLSGNEWYCQQAFRALNQATGRCIRHRFDYGAIIFLDERFCEERNRISISKWFRKCIRQYDDFEKSLEELKLFFRDVKDGVAKAKLSLIPEVEVDNTPSIDKNKRITEKKTQKENRPISSSDCLITEDGVSLCQPFMSAIKTDSMNKRNTSCCREYIDLECETQENSSWSKNMSTMCSLDDPDITIVKETPDINGFVPAVTSENVSNIELSNLVAFPSSNELPDHSPRSPISLINTSSAPKYMSFMSTPESFFNGNRNITIPEIESPYNWSANSCSKKRRKTFGSSSDSLQVQQCGALVGRTNGGVSLMTSSITMVNPTQWNNTGSQITNPGKEFLNLGSLQSSSLVDGSDTMTLVPDMDERLQIFCSACKTPLGLPANNLLVTCSQTSSSKLYLRSLWKGKVDESTSSIPVIITDVESMDQRLCDNSKEAVPGGSGQGTWCKEDGCVFNRVFCPSCSNSNCLGVQVMATDALNSLLQNKILFFSDLLEIRNLAARRDEDLPPSGGSCTGKRNGLDSIEKFAYTPLQQNSGGWRTTKSKMRLPKKGLLSTPEG